MELVPPYVSTVFILTTFAAVAFLLQAAKHVGLGKLPSQILIFLLPLWIFFQAVISIGGFYQDTNSMPPRIVLFGVLPALLTIVTYLIFFRERFIDKIPLRLLTMLHVVRVPVEIVLLWLFQNGQVPQLMTFEGRNFDILSGILAPIVYLIAFRGEKPKRGLLIAYNILGLILLANIVSIAALSIPSPIQQLAFEQPNRAVTFFPYSWLPAIVVPIVLFSHLAAFWKLLISKTA
ncbi:MAG: hypothetical protein IPI64_09055 [Chloracidobacterium sp.]|nr:hypothetical protein [Chloracidobacterium sp.]